LDWSADQLRIVANSRAQSGYPGLPGEKAAIIDLTHNASVIDAILVRGKPLNNCTTMDRRQLVILTPPDFPLRINSRFRQTVAALTRLLHSAREETRVGIAHGRRPLGGGHA
jgi:hypothetical protein